ncbi:hypothetical protein Tco_1167585 [Tanacetum coccineum]
MGGSEKYVCSGEMKHLVSKSRTHYPCDLARTFRVTLFSFTVTNGNPSSVNIKQHCGSLILAKSDSLPHAHTQALKVNHSTSRLLLLNKNIRKVKLRSTLWEIDGIDEEEKVASFQDKYEHMKDLKNSKSNDEGSRSRSQSMNEQSRYQQEKTKTRPKKAKLKSQIKITSNKNVNIGEIKVDLNIGEDC